jgi:hypothetical protein
MLRQISSTVLAAALFLPAGASLASSTVALRGDGHCPTERYSSDPDCAREGSQQLSKSSRDEFPDCMNGTCTNRRSTAVVAGRHQGDQFPGNRQGGGSGPALPAPRAV